MKRVCVLGSNSGRNAGDAAILSSIIHNLRRLKPGTLFDVPVPRKRDLYSRFDPDVARAVPMMPWYLSLRMIGLPTLLSVMRSDVMLITDGIIFDVRLLNPLFNFLIQLVFLVLPARLARTRIVCLLVGVGPLESRLGRRLAAWVCRSCDDILVRDEASAALLESVGVPRERMAIYADAAFLARPASPERVQQILAENGLADAGSLIGFNVNSYLDRWLKTKGGMDADSFLRELGRTLDAVVERWQCPVVLVITQVMDIPFAERLLARVKCRERVVLVSNRQYTAEEIMGVLGALDLLVGMRLHSLILAAAVGTPCIGLAYAPKVRGFMTLLGQPELTQELAELTCEALLAKIESVLDDRDSVQRALATRVGELKVQAEAGFLEFAERYL